VRCLLSSTDSISTEASLGAVLLVLLYVIAGDRTLACAFTSNAGSEWSWMSSSLRSGKLWHRATAEQISASDTKCKGSELDMMESPLFVWLGELCNALSVLCGPLLEKKIFAIFFLQKDMYRDSDSLLRLHKKLSQSKPNVIQGESNRCDSNENI